MAWLYWPGSRSERLVMGALKGGSATHISTRAPDSFLVSLLSKFNLPDLGIPAGNLDAISCLKTTNCHPKEGLQQGQVTSLT